MTERKQYPRRVNIPGWSISLLNKIGFTLSEQPIGEIHTLTGDSGQLTADITHEQLIYQRQDGSILRVPAKNRMLFFHDQQPVEQIDPTKAEGPFSRKLKVDSDQNFLDQGGDLKPTEKYPQSFKLKR